MAYTFLNFAEESLAQAEYPLTHQEVWELGCSLGYREKLRTKGKTPQTTLGAHLYVSVRDKPDSPFLKVGKRPARFFLKSRQAQIPDDFEAVAEEKAVQNKPKFKERQLHPLLAGFVANSPLFHGSKTIYTKTIYHESSKKRGYGEWTHPDMVGVYMPINDWERELLEFSKASHQSPATLFSFELKRYLDRSNYRESFFQAVSNSSWAHEGYLVTAQIAEDDDLNEELERLSTSFGIGIILLDVADVNDSRVVLPATSRQELDWATMNKLCDSNPDFQSYLKNVTADMKSDRISSQEYDSWVDHL